MCGRASLNIERWSASAKPHALGWRRHSAPYWNPGATRRHIAGRALWATPAECRKPQVCGLHPLLPSRSGSRSLNVRHLREAFHGTGCTRRFTARNGPNWAALPSRPARFRTTRSDEGSVAEGRVDELVLAATTAPYFVTMKRRLFQVDPAEASSTTSTMRAPERSMIRSSSFRGMENISMTGPSTWVIRRLTAS